MSRNASGTYSLPGANPVVTGTIIASAWGNTTLSDLATEITDSLSRSNKGGMLAALGIVDGNVGAPGIGFNSETNTGLYRAGAGDLRVGVAGTNILKITAGSLQSMVDGTTGAPAFTFGNETNSGLRRAGAGDLRATIGGTDILSITASGVSPLVGPAVFTKKLTSSLTTTNTVTFTSASSMDITVLNGESWVIEYILDLSLGASSISLQIDTPTYTYGSGITSAALAIATFALNTPVTFDPGSPDFVRITVRLHGLTAGGTVSLKFRSVSGSNIGISTPSMVIATRVP